VTKNPSARADPRAIQAVLNRYRDAISTLDFAAVRAVWPSADIEALRKEFAGVRDQNVEFEACRISSIEAGASALCAGVVESGFRPGDRRPRVERRRWEFTLRRFGARWQITEVHSPRG
jgi:ketosteroid isomerase-like protein